MKTRIQKWGNSQGLRFPRHILREAHISVGDEVEITSRNGVIVVKPNREIRGKHDLKKRVAGMPRSYKAVEEDWGGMVGKEVW
jgi:antitoxin MazE